MKYLQHLNKVNLSAISLTTILGCLAFKENSVGLAISTVGVCVLYGWKLYLDYIKKPDFSQKMLEELAKVKGELQSLKMAQGVKNPLNEKQRYF